MIYTYMLDFVAFNGYSPMHVCSLKLSNGNLRDRLLQRSLIFLSSGQDNEWLE